jgi:hypothetical protein
MKKLRLDLENIAVESFETDRAPAAGGTVRGYASIAQPCSGQCDTVDDATCDRDRCTNTGPGNDTCVATVCAELCSGGVLC